MIIAIGSVPGTPQRVNLSAGPKTTAINSMAVVSSTAPKRNAARVQSSTTNALFNRSDIIPVVVPQNNSRFDQAVESRKEGLVGRTMPLSLQARALDIRKFSNGREDLERLAASSPAEVEIPKAIDVSGVADRNILPLGKQLFGS